MCNKDISAVSAKDNDEAVSLLAQIRTDLETLGFGDDDASVSGADLVDAMNIHYQKMLTILSNYTM